MNVSTHKKNTEYFISESGGHPPPPPPPRPRNSQPYQLHASTHALTGQAFSTIRKYNSSSSTQTDKMPTHEYLIARPNRFTHLYLKLDPAAYGIKITESVGYLMSPESLREADLIAMATSQPDRLLRLWQTERRSRRRKR